MKSYDKIFKALVSLLFFTLFTACSDDSSAPVDQGNANKVIPINSLWKSDCYDDPNGTGSFDETLEFTSDTIIESAINLYIDTQCTTLSFSESPTIKYVYGGEITTTSGVTAKEIDVTSIAQDGNPVPVVDQSTLYGIIHLNSSGTIFHFGQDSGTKDGSSLQKRHDTLDFNFNWTKQ